MGFFENIFGKAKDIVNNGKDVLRDQLGSELVVQKDESGKVNTVSDTGNVPKIARTLISNRGFSDEEIKTAQPTRRDTALGIAKTAGEIAQGGVDLVSGIGNLVASPFVPGAVENSRQYKRKLNEKVSEKLAPSTPGQAKIMRAGDVAGFLPVGSVSKVSRLDDLSDAARNSLKNNDTGVRNKSLEFFRENPDEIAKGEVRLRELEDGSIFIEDGRHRLQAGTETGVAPKIVDVTAEYTGQPSVKVAQIKMDIESAPAPKQKTSPRTQTGELNVDEYVKQQTKAREAARGKTPLTQRVNDFLKNLEDKAVDFTAPIQRRYDKALKDDPVFAAAKGNDANIKDNIDRVFNAPAITQAFVKQKGFAEAVQSIDPKNLDAFDQYLTAKHAIDLDAKGIKTGRNIEADRALVNQLDGEFSDASSKIQKYNEERLEYMVESGLISRELKDSLLERYPNYVPFQRVFDEAELAAGADTFTSSGVASLSKQSVINKIVGSEREIESPLESLLDLTSKAVQQGEKNKAALELVSYADIKGNPFGLRKISKTTDKAADMDTISVLRDGKKEIWEVYPDVAKAAKALDVERMNILGKILAAPLRLARLGITGVNVPFVAANVARDQISAFIMSDKGLRSSAANPRIWLAGLGEAINHGKLYDEMLSEGALMTSFDVVRDSVNPTLKGVMADKSAGSKAMYIAKNPSQWFRAVENAIGRSEEVTRMQQYLGNKQAALAEGMTEAQARNMAARAARENSTNFARRGEWGTVMNNTILYLNAGIQGSRLLVRNLKNKPVQTGTKIASTLMLPVATATYWNLSDPKRKEAYESIRPYEKENNLIIVPPNPVYDEETERWNVIKVPLPPGVGQFANFVRRPIEDSQGLDEVQFSEAASTLLRTFSPIDAENPMSSLTPQIIKPSLQAGTNKNFFTGYDIVPKSMQDLPPEQQIKDNTSGTARIIANTINQSPIKTEQFINDTLGGIGPQILNASDRALAATGVIEESEIGGRSLPESVARRFTSAAGGAVEAEQLDEIYSLISESRGESTALKNLAADTLATLQSMPKDQANVEFKRIFEDNRNLYNEIQNLHEEEKLGLTRIESAIKQMPVKDGTRAAYIYQEYKNIQQYSPEDAKAYLKELRQKKVISDAVFEQLKALREEDNDTI